MSDQNKTNHTPEEPAFFDELINRRRRQKSGRGTILGAPGSIKLDAVKQQIQSILRNSDDPVILFDTEGQYCSLAEEMGGQIISISLGSHVYINPLDICMDYVSTGDMLPVKADFIVCMLDAFVGGRYGLSPAQKSILYHCTHELYAPYSIYKDNSTGGYDSGLIPTLRDLYRVLRTQNTMDSNFLADALYMYVSGGFNLFSYPSNTPHMKQLVVYDLRHLPSDLKTSVLLNTLEHVYTHYISPEHQRKKRKSAWIFIDDVYPMFQNESTAIYLRTFYKCIRPLGTIPTFITNYADVLLSDDLGRNMICDSDYIYLTNLPPVSHKKAFELFQCPTDLMEYASGRHPAHALIYEVDTPERLTVLLDNRYEVKR